MFPVKFALLQEVGRCHLSGKYSLCHHKTGVILRLNYNNWITYVILCTWKSEIIDWDIWYSVLGKDFLCPGILQAKDKGFDQLWSLKRCPLLRFQLHVAMSINTSILEAMLITSSCCFDSWWTRITPTQTPGLLRSLSAVGKLILCFGNFLNRRGISEAEKLSYMGFAKFLKITKHYDYVIVEQNQNTKF